MTKYSQLLIRIVFALTVLLLILNFFFLVNNIHDFRDDQKWVNHTNIVKTQIDQTLLTITQAEAAQREYIITGNDAYKNILKSLSLQNNSNSSTLKKLTSDNPEQIKNATQFITLINQRFYSLNNGINLRDTQGEDVADAYIQKGIGKKIMEQIVDKSKRMTDTENNLLTARINASEQTYNNILLSSAVGFFITIFFIILGYMLVMTELQRRKDIEKLKDEFISMASHELKTPITSIKMYVDIAKRKTDNKKNSLNILDKIDNQLNRLTKLVSDLLDISRIQTGKIRIDPTDFQLKELIVEVADALQQTTEKHNVLIKGSQGIFVYADRYRTYQVLMNLINNAIKYSPYGGNIIITLQKTDHFAEISVKDHGIGIDKLHQEKIFERLYQVSEPTEKTYPGLGIGLYITSEMVRMQRGSIWVKSEKGIGSTFTFTLPLENKITA